MGFEFGYSLLAKKTFVIWEAQYGDFVNGAQTIIDQYLSSSLQKWGKSCNLTLLLPHGYEGAGPEHSSARIERFLQLSALDNFRVVIPTTPVQYYHILRDQAAKERPCVILTPKAFLRHPLCVSNLEDFSEKTFETVLDDPRSNGNFTKILLCFGKMYYDLVAYMEKNSIPNVGLIRLEQLYPLDKKKVAQLLGNHKNAKKIFYVQEEPKNMGPFMFFAEALKELIPKGATFAMYARDESATTAAGSHALHEREFSSLMETIFNS